MFDETLDPYATVAGHPQDPSAMLIGLPQDKSAVSLVQIKAA